MDSSIAQSSIQFSAKLILLLDSIKNREYIKEQIMQTIGSMGSNIIAAQHESGRQERNHFIKAALTDCRSLSYWLQLLLAANSITDSQNITLQHLYSKLYTSLMQAARTEEPRTPVVCPMTPRNQ